MNRLSYKIRKSFFNWLLGGFLIEFTEKERTFQIQIIAEGKTVKTQNMYIVPCIGSKVEVLENDYPNPEITRLFLVKDIIYSPHGAANKLIGKFIN